MSNSDRTESLLGAGGPTWIFAIGFTGGGLLILLMALGVIEPEEGPIEPGPTRFIAVMASLLFLTVGGFFLFFNLRRLAGTPARNRRQKRHPDSPWLWRRDWASGSIVSGNKGINYGALFLAVICALFTVTFAIGLFHAEGKVGAVILFLGACCVFGTAFHGWFACYSLLQFQKYGASRLELDFTPGCLGGTLEGRILVRRPVRAADGFAVTLTCLHRRFVSSGDRSRSLEDRALWQDRRQVDPLPSRRRNRTLIPVYFEIPAELPEADPSDPANQVIWQLLVTAQTPGIDYEAEFAVPVFRTDETGPETEGEEEEEAAPRRRGPARLARPRHERAIARRERDGALVVQIKPIGERRQVIGTIGFAVAMLIVAVVLLGCGSLMSLFFLAAAGLLGWWLSVLLTGTRIVVGDELISLEQVTFGRVRRRDLALERVGEFVARRGYEVQDARGRALDFWDLCLLTRSGKTVLLARHVGSQARVERMAKELTAAVESRLD